MSEFVKKTFNRIWQSLVVAYFIWKNPSAVNESLFKITQKLFEFITTVQSENKPYFTKFGFIHPDDGELPVVTIWAAPGSGSAPEKRITELIEENQRLKGQIVALMDKTTKPE